jgi:hydroxyacylglutathione hydrolase
VSPIPAFEDNYIWLLRESGRTNCAVVDPGDADPVIERLDTEGWELTAILITHKHGDHTGGVRELKMRWPQSVVYGPVGEPIPTLERRLREGDQVELIGIGARFRVLDVPGHTEGHIAYYGEGALFCGDTLFAGGCGRVFSGTHEQLSASLEKIAGLPAQTRVYCAHEYTLANLGFARWVEPESSDLAARLAEDRAVRDRGEPTVPSTLELELRTNPFLRTDRPAVAAAAERWHGAPLDSRAAVFRALRTWKDRDYD